MGKWFLLAVLALPIVEIALFVEVGGVIGVWATLGLVVLGAVIGAALLRHNSIQTLIRLQPGLVTGKGSDIAPIADRALLALAGLLLLVPGFFTDAVALLLLVPAVRARLIVWAGDRMIARMDRMETARPAARDTIDVDYEVVEDPGPAVRGRSGWTRH